MPSLSDLARMVEGIQNARREEAHAGAFGSLNGVNINFSLPVCQLYQCTSKTSIDWKTTPVQGTICGASFKQLYSGKNECVAQTPLGLHHAYSWCPALDELDGNQREDLYVKRPRPIANLAVGHVKLPIVK